MAHANHFLDDTRHFCSPLISFLGARNSYLYLYASYWMYISICICRQARVAATTTTMAKCGEHDYIRRRCEAQNAGWRICRVEGLNGAVLKDWKEKKSSQQGNAHRTCIIAERPMKKHINLVWMHSKISRMLRWNLPIGYECPMLVSGMIIDKSACSWRNQR